MLAVPRIISSRRQSQMAEMQKQIALSLSEARRESISQGVRLIWRYDNINKIIVTYNGNFGALGDARNRVIDISNFGFEKSEIVYGRPIWTPNTPLADASNLTELRENSIEITFQPDGSVLDEANKPQNNALFFYHQQNYQDAAFAVSVSGEGGQAKVWKYSNIIKDYVEKK
jgi:Tfp pilus assembly protein FimT